MKQGMLRKALVAGFVWLVGLYVAVLAITTGQMILAGVWVVLLSAATWVYLDPRLYPWRYLFPGLLGMAVFVVTPMLYTIIIGFTNYSSPNHLHSVDRSREILAQEMVFDDGAARVPFVLRGDDAGQLQVVLEIPADEPEEATSQSDENVELIASATAPMTADELSGLTEPLQATNEQALVGEALSRRDIIKNSRALKAITVGLPDGRSARYLTLSAFVIGEPRFQIADDTLVDRTTNEVYAPNLETGFFESADGTQLTPGFRINIGFENFVRTFTDPKFQGPFIQIFVWTVVFALLSVFFSTTGGIILGCLLDWPALKGRKIYQALLFLPYAVPAFISILIFRGLFSNAGEINKILDVLLPFTPPEWFSDPIAAKAMIIVVNTWLGFPYIMVLTMGMLKAIPEDLYEASALEGASPWVNFSKITLPLLLRPLMPLLIASFAFNFNNFVLINLLTGGRPDIIGAQVPAGTTDILVSYTYRIAFEDAGRDFGLAGAISTVVFILVSILALVQIKLTKSNKSAA